MNKIYRIVWNKARQCLVVVGENAHTAVKASGGSGTHPVAAGAWRRALAAVLALAQIVCPPFAAAQTTIKTDGRTQTTVTNAGTVYGVSTATQSGQNAFNSFSAFSVGAGNTVNMYVPASAINLINIVRDQRTDVYGVLNAIKDGRIGGNVWFANPYGFVVGASGVVNVGSLTVSTPTQQFVDGFFSAPGMPDPASVTQLLSGTAPRNGSALVAVYGKINAADGVALSAGAIKVAGSIYSGARFVGAAPDFTDVVNANGLASATNVVLREGRIEIVADHDVTLSGTLAAPGGTGVRGGTVSVAAGGDIELSDGALISVRGDGADSAGGTVSVRGDGNAALHAGALIDASAGSSGDGGAIEFSARKTVTLAGGQFLADGWGGGKAGSVLIDPTDIDISANLNTGGANYTLAADGAITLDPGIVVSTRKVADGADQESAASTGASGNITLQAASIALASGSKLLAQGDSGFAGGDVTLSATRGWTGEAKISADNATIKGRNVTLTASASYDDSLLTSWLPVSVPVTVAGIDLKSSRIAASGDLTLAATSLIDVSSTGLLPLGMITAVSTAKVDVNGASQLSSGGASKLNASSTVRAKAAPGGPNPTSLPGDAGVAINVIVSTAQAHLGDSSTLNAGGALEITAKNAVTATTKADASAGGAVGVGGTLALSEVTSVTTAGIDGSAATQSAALKVAAESANAVTTSAKAAAKGATKQTAAEKSAAPSQSEATLAKYKDQASTADGSVEVAAAVAIANVNSITQAVIASSGTQSATGAAEVSSKASSSSTVTADGSSVSGAVGVGAAVGLNLGVLLNQARIADNSQVSGTGLTLSAAMSSDSAKNNFVTSATSGAGASNVGVAGALAANVLINTTTATLESDGVGLGASVNANAGDLVVEAKNNSASSVTAGANVKPASASQPAEVGVGASVGMNVAVNTTLAEVQDGAQILGGKDFDLNAKAAHTITTTVSGGAAGANVSVTPLAAVAVAVNTTSARLGSGNALLLGGDYASSAEQSATTTTSAIGQTVGDKVAVGASIAFTSATDTVVAALERDVSAAGAVSVDAKSTAKSSTTAKASAKGGQKSADKDKAAASGSGTAGKSVDEQVTAQGTAAKNAGKTTAAASSPAAAGTAAKLDTSKDAPKSEDSTEAGGVSVAAAVGVNVGVATTQASIGQGRKISSGGATSVTSTAQTDAQATADGSQVNSGTTDVGIGAAVALNTAVASNRAVIGDNAEVTSKGLTVSALMPLSGSTSEKNDFGADAKSGAGASDVGVAGSLAVNVVVNSSEALLEGDKDTSGAGFGHGASVNAGGGKVTVAAQNLSISTVNSGADVKTGSQGEAGTVGVGASVGMNVAVNTTRAEVEDAAVLNNGGDVTLKATADHALNTTVKGGTAGAKVAVTPVAAVTLAVNTTTARLGAGSQLLMSGDFSSTAEHKGSTTTLASGQTQGDQVAVGASIALGTEVDTVTAAVDRDVNASGAFGVTAKSTAKSSTTATASVKGGQKADDKPVAGGGSTPAKSVDEQVGAQGAAAKKAGGAADAAGKAKLESGDAAAEKPKAETSDGGVSVAAAVGVNVGVATTQASIGRGRKISSGGAASVTSTAQMDALAKADGSQVDSGKTDVGVGAAVALNTAVASNRAVIGDNAEVTSTGLTVSALMPLSGSTSEKNDFGADAKSGAGAGDVGVAGSLAVNVVVNTTEALLEGDKDTSGAGFGHGASVNAGGGDVTIMAKNVSVDTVVSGATVKTGSQGEAGTVGVGASLGVNVVVNSTRAEAEDLSVLTHAGDVGVTADAKHTLSTTVTGGAAGAKVSITPVVAVGVAVNTTTARLGTSAAALDMNGDLALNATQSNVVTTKASGQAVGDVAVGASLAASVSLDHVAAALDRDVAASTGMALAAASETSIRTEAKAGAKGAKAAAKNPTTGAETPEKGSTVDEQKENQLNAAASKNTATNNSSTKAALTNTPEAKTPDANKDESGGNKESGKKVSVAAAIGVSVAENQATATTGAGRQLHSSGDLSIAASTGTNYNTVATGEAVSDNVGVAAAVALSATRNKTQATLGADSTVVAPGRNITITATAEQNRDAGFLSTMSAEAVSGASGGDVAVAGSLAVVLNDNETRASIDEGATLGASGTPLGDIVVKAEDTSKIAARARAGALSKGSDSKAGVGASFAVLLAANQTTAAVGYGASASDAKANIFADSLTIKAIKNRIDFTPLKIATDFKNADFFDKLDPTNYINQVNYYTEAVAGAAAKGDAAVSGAFSVNVFGNTTEARLDHANVTTSGSQSGGSNGVQVASSSDINALAIGGAVAGAKKAGVGISNTDIVNSDQVLAAVSGASKVISNGAAADIKVSADSRQDISNVSVSGAAATSGTAVGGVLGVIVSLNKTEATIGEASAVSAQGSVSVGSTNDSTMVLVSGGVAGGKDVGVGGAIAANIVKNQTYASIGKDAEVNALKNVSVTADADETAVAVVVAGAGGGKVGAAAALSLDTLLTDTQASIGEGARINAAPAFAAAEKLSVSAHDDSVIVGVAGGGAGGGKVGVGAAIDTTVLLKTVKAFIADDSNIGSASDDGRVATLKAGKEISVDAAASETLVSTVMGFGGGGTVGVGGAVSVAVDKNDVQAYIGKSAQVDANGNVLLNAQDDVTAVLTAGAGAGGGNTGVGASLAVATLLESSRAYIGDGAQVNARGNADAATVYSGDTVFSDTASKPSTLGAKLTESVKGLSVTAYNRENLVTTVVGGAGGGTAGVAATVSANVIASTTEASIGRAASINVDNTLANVDQQVRVKAVDESLLIDTAGAGAGGGSAGVGAAANVGVIAKTTTAKIGKQATVKARKAVEVDAASSDISVTTTAGFAGGGSAGVGGAVAGVGVANSTQAFIEDGTAAAEAAKISVSGGKLELAASEFASSWLLTGAAAGGGAAGVGGSLAAGVNASTTLARIGDYAETGASGTTSVHADSTENVNTVTVAGAGGGSAGVAGAISVNVIVAKTEAGIGKHAQVNQGISGQNVDVAAHDRIISVGAGGAAAGGGAAGVGGTANVTVALNTTSAYIDNDAAVSATQDVAVNAASEKYVNSVTFSGAGGGAAGVAGAVSVISVGSLLDGEARSGLSPKGDDGKTATTQSQSDGQLTKSAVGGMLGDSAQAKETTTLLDGKAKTLAVGDYMAESTPIPLKNTQAFIGYNATVKAGGDLTVAAADKTLAIVGAGAGAGGGAAGVSGSLGVVLLHDSAEAFIADGAHVDAGKTLSVSAQTAENVFNVGITGGGAGAADVSGSLVVNVVSSDTAAYIGAAQINKDAGIGLSNQQSVSVNADSDSTLVTVAANGGGAGAASVGGVLDVNTLIKNTKAYIGEGAAVSADRNVSVTADSAENVIAGGISIHGAGAAAVSGVVAVNVIANKTEAFIGAGRDDSSKGPAAVDSDGNVTLSAVDDSLIVAVTGSGNGAGAAGVGATLGANVLSSETRAYVGDNSAVNARGNAAAVDVYSGVIDNATPTAMPTVDGVGSGEIKSQRDGTRYGNVSGGASFSLKADGDTGSTVDPAAQGSGSKSIAGASGGMGSKAKRAIKGLAVQALGNEKMITATIGVAGAGAAAVTGAATADVVASVTEAAIGDGAKINQSGATGSDPSVRVGAADNTFMVQAGGTISGAGAAAVSGTVNTAVIAKTTSARIGDADVYAGNVEVAAAASERLYSVTANVSIAGAAGVGAAVAVDVVSNSTTASVGAGAKLDATGDIRVHAAQDTAVDIYTVAGAGGIVGVSGAISVAVVDNTTRAYVEGATTPAAAATLDAGGTTEVRAESKENVSSVTVSAAGGGVGVAGAVGVKVVKSDSEAFIGDNVAVNQTRRQGAGLNQDVLVSASDDVLLNGGGGSGAVGGFAGAGATADVNIIRNTTTAYVGEAAKVNADRDLSVTAASSKEVKSVAVAAAGGGSLGIGGAVAVVSIGTALDTDTQNSLKGSDGDKKGDTASYADSQMKSDNVSGQMGNSEHVAAAGSGIAAAKQKASGGKTELSVSGDMNGSSTDRTRAYVGSKAVLTAGHDVKVSAQEAVKVDVSAAGAAGGFVGLGGAFALADVHSGTEAFIGASTQVDAGNNVLVEARAENVRGEESVVRSAAGAGGIVGLSAAVSVMNDSSTTQAHVDDKSAISRAMTVKVNAATARQAQTETLGATIGGLAIGASVARTNFSGSSSAYFGDDISIGKTSGKKVDNVIVSASDESTATAAATAGSAGIYSGAGADANASIGSTVDAHIGQRADIVAQDNVTVDAKGMASADASAIGVSAGLAAVGVSRAAASVNDTVIANVGASSTLTADLLTVSAHTALPASGDTAHASSIGAAGGLLGVNGTTSDATYQGSTTSSIGDNSTVNGSVLVSAETDTRQSASAAGVAVGLIAAGANLATASSQSDTQAYLGSLVTVSGDKNSSLTVTSGGTDDNFASAIAGSGGIIAGSAAVATTSGISNSAASLGRGDNLHQIGVGSVTVDASHSNRFNGEVDSVNASIAGASGAYAGHLVISTVLADVGDNARVSANHVDISAENTVEKAWLGSADGDAATWNIRSGSGGVIDAPAGKSESHVIQSTQARVGDNAQIHLLAPDSGVASFTMDAYNALIVHDKAKLDSGGAIAIAQAASLINVYANDRSDERDRSDATASFGSHAQVISDLGDINAGARASVDLDARAVADTYGLAGAPAGTAYAVFRGSNQTLVNDGALLRADDGAINLGGGQSSSGTPTSINARSTVNLWNKTVIPIATVPDAWSKVVNDAGVSILGSGKVEAAGDIALYADRGSVNATAVGIGKDIYREALAAIASGISELFGGGKVSFDIHGGSTDLGGLARVRVDGTATTGIHRTADLTLNIQLVDASGHDSAVPVYVPVYKTNSLGQFVDAAGKVVDESSSSKVQVGQRVLWRLDASASKGVTYSVDPAVGIGADILARIAKLRSLMAQYAGDAVAAGAYQSEINFLMVKLVELGLAAQSGTDAATGQPIVNPGQFNNPSPKQAAQTQLTQYQAQLSDAVGKVNSDATTVTGTATAALGSVGSIATQAGTLDSNATTIATANASIDGKLQTLSKFDAANVLYQKTYVGASSLVASNATLQSEISTQKGLNSTDQSAIAGKSGEITTLLNQIKTLSSQAEIDSRQATISQRTSEIKSLLNDISTRNSDISSKAAQIANNNLSIDANQATLATTFSGSGDTATVASITTARNGIAGERTTVSTAASTIAGEQAKFSAPTTGYLAVVGAQDTDIQAKLGISGNAETQIATLNTQLPTLSSVPANGPTADFVHVNDITVKLGNIRTKGDVLSGHGALQAPGDAQINITNNTPDFLVVNNLTVAGDDGGTVRFNGVLVNTPGEVNRLNAGGTGAEALTLLTRDTQSAPKPSISVTSNYNPLAAGTTVLAPSPNIELAGDITNPGGSVTVRSKAGSILADGTIRAGTVDVKADNGDFVQSYVDNFFHVGGDPASIHDSGTALGGGIIANGSVFLSARYLNINSLVQSGIVNWNLTLPQAPILTGPASFFGIADAAIATAKDNYLHHGGAQYTSFSLAAGTVRYNAAADRIEADMAFADADKNTSNWLTRTGSSGGLYALVQDYGNIGARYDPVNHRFELDGTQVRGGYIQLYGQIINTSTGEAGTLRALDGYGQIQVVNPTGLAVVINTLDTGTDRSGTGRGVEGVIDITDIQGIGSGTALSTTHTVYTRNNGVLYRNGVADATASDSRDTHYTPQTDLRYVWTTGTDNSSIAYWEYSGAQFFGSSDLRTAPTGHVESHSGPFVLNAYRLDNGTYLSTGATLGGDHAAANTASNPYGMTKVTTSNGSPLWVKTDEWSNCNWWTLCIAQDYHMTFTETIPTKTIETKSLKADNPINIQFSGWDTGTVKVSSASDVLLKGAIRNSSGSTTISAGSDVEPLSGVSLANRSIVQLNDAALISSRDLALKASGSIGKALDADPAKAVAIAINGGTLDASAGNGNVIVMQTTGDLRLGKISAAGDALSNLGRIDIEADGNIVAASAASEVQGNRIELTSDNGGIGSTATPLGIKAGYTDDYAQRRYYGLKAEARGDIGIASATWSGNLAGDLLVDRVVSSGGDVRLVSKGRILDNNPNETIDTRTWAQLLSYWDSVGLVKDSKANSDKQAQTIKAYESGKTQDYRLYWQLRQRQADPSAYDSGFQYHVSASERTALVAQGMSAADITAFEGARTTQYHQLNSTVGAYNGGSYSSTFAYTVSADEKTALLDGAAWSTRELGISVGAGMLKDITNTNPVVKSANVQGRNVTLDAAVAIGETQTAVTIPTSIDPSALSEAQKVALAAAERSDFDSTDTLITVLRRKPVNFAAAEALSVSVTAAPVGKTDTGSAFLASLGDARLDAIDVSGETRIKVRGSIVNENDGTPAVHAGNLVLEAANGGIGYLPDSGFGASERPLRLALHDGATLIARAADKLEINETAGDLNVDTVYSRNDVRLFAHGSIVDAYPTSDLNILAQSLWLTAQSGSIGSAANPLDVGVNLDGMITAGAASAGQGVYLNAPLGHSFNIAAVTSGDAIKLSADADMTIDGALRAPGPIGLNAGGAMQFTANARVHSALLTTALDAGTLSMADGAQLISDLGTIDITTVGDARVTGIASGNATASAVSITSRSGRILAGHTPGSDHLDIVADAAPDAKLTMTAALGIGDEPLNVRLRNLKATSGGGVDLAVQDAVVIDSITAAGRVALSAGGDISGKSVLSSGGGSSPDTSISLRSENGGVTLDSVSGASSVALAARTGIDVGNVNALDRVSFAAPEISANVFGGAAPLAGTLGGFAGGPAERVSLTLSGAGGFVFDSFWAATAAVSVPLGSLRIGETRIVDRATFHNPTTRVLVDQHNKSIQAADVQLYTGGDPFPFFLSGNSVGTNAFVIHRGAQFEVITPTGTNTSVDEQGALALARIKPPPTPPSGPGTGDGTPGDLLTFTGVPVSLDCATECAE